MNLGVATLNAKSVGGSYRTHIQIIHARAFP